jgi:multidrug resistance efflux pump
VQLDAAQASLDDVERRVRVGVEPEDALLPARIALHEAESRMRTLRLEEEEVRATGREPDDELSAPLVGGRDFVTERLDLQRGRARERLARADREWTRIQGLVRTGIVSAEEADPAELALEQARQALRLVETELDARRAFLGGELGPDEAVRRVERERLASQLAVGRLVRERAAGDVERMERLAAVGAVQEAELRRARLELTQRELAVELLLRKLELLDSLSSGEAPGESG